MSWPTNNWAPNYNGQRAVGPLSMSIKPSPNTATDVTPQIQDNNAIFAAADKAQANDPASALDPKIASARCALQAMGLMIPPGKAQTVPEAGATKHAEHGDVTQKVLFRSPSYTGVAGNGESPRRVTHPAPYQHGEPVKAAGALSFLQPLARKIPKEWLSGDMGLKDIAADAYRNWFARNSLPGNTLMKAPGDYYLRTPQVLRDLDMTAMRQQNSRLGPRIDGDLFGPSHDSTFDFAKQAGLFGLARGVGKALSAVPKAVAAAPKYIKNTFKPGVSTLRKQMRSTDLGRGPTRNYSSPDPLGGAVYRPYFHSASTTAAKGTRRGAKSMRHELSHAATAPWTGPVVYGGNEAVVAGSGLRGAARKLMQAPEGSWRRGAGNVLDETIAYASEGKSIPGQIARGAGYLANPAVAALYAGQYGAKGGLIHGLTGLGGTGAVVGGGIYGTGKVVDRAFQPSAEEIAAEDTRKTEWARMEAKNDAATAAHAKGKVDWEARRLLRSGTKEYYAAQGTPAEQTQHARDIAAFEAKHGPLSDYFGTTMQATPATPAQRAQMEMKQGLDKQARVAGIGRLARSLFSGAKKVRAPKAKPAPKPRSSYTPKPRPTPPKVSKPQQAAAAQAKPPAALAKHPGDLETLMQSTRYRSGPRVAGNAAPKPAWWRRHGRAVDRGLLGILGATTAGTAYAGYETVQALREKESPFRAYRTSFARDPRMAAVPAPYGQAAASETPVAPASRADMENVTAAVGPGLYAADPKKLDLLDSWYKQDTWNRDDEHPELTEGQMRRAVQRRSPEGGIEWFDYDQKDEPTASGLAQSRGWRGGAGPSQVALARTQIPERIQKLPQESFQRRGVEGRAVSRRADIALHELEHTHQGTTLGHKVHSGSSPAHEIPAAVSQIAHFAARQRPEKEMVLSPSFRPTAGSLANQARQHGHVEGKAPMTKLLGGTSEGRAWLQTRAREFAEAKGRGGVRRKELSNKHLYDHSEGAPGISEQIRVQLGKEQAQRVQDAEVKHKFNQTLAERGGAGYMSAGEAQAELRRSAKSLLRRQLSQEYSTKGHYKDLLDQYRTAAWRGQRSEQGRLRTLIDQLESSGVLSPGLMQDIRREGKGSPEETNKIKQQLAESLPKQGLDKQAVLEPIWGGLGGAYSAPKTKRLEGAARGAGVGATSMLGGMGTGALGYHLAKGRNLGTTSIAGYDIPNEVLVGLASSLPGNALGYLAGKEMFWPDRWEDPKDRVKEDVADLIGLKQGG